MKRFILPLICLFVSQVELNAAEANASYGGAAAHVAITFTTTTNLHFRRWGNIGGSYHFNYGLYKISGNGGSITTTVFDLSMTQNSDVEGDVTITAGQWYRIYAAVLNSSNQIMANSGGTGAWGMLDFQAPTTLTALKIKVTVNNPLNTPLIVRGVHPVDGQLFQITLQPGDTFSGTYTVTTSAPVAISYAIPGVQTDGNLWTYDPTDLTDVGFVDAGSVTPEQVNVSADPTPTPLPNAATITPNATPQSITTKNVWSHSSTVTNEAGTSDFTVAAYREGVDKLVNAIEGPSAGSVTLSTPTTAWNPDTAVVTAAIAKLPQLPNITAPSAVHAISVTIPMPGIGNKTMTVDFAEAPFAGPIAIFRGLMLVVLTLMYFFMSFKAIRGAFAGS